MDCKTNSQAHNENLKIYLRFKLEHICEGTIIKSIQALINVLTFSIL